MMPTGSTRGVRAAAVATLAEARPDVAVGVSGAAVGTQCGIASRMRSVIPSISPGDTNTILIPSMTSARKSSSVPASAPASASVCVYASKYVLESVDRSDRTGYLLSRRGGI